MVEPVAQTVGMTLVYLADGHIDIEAFVDLVGSFLGCEDDAYGKDVVYFVEAYVLVLHLVPNGIRALYTCLDLILYAHLVEFLPDGLCELREEGVALCLSVGKFVLDVGILLWVIVAEAEVFELGLYFVKAQTVGQWSVDVKCLAGYLVLLVGRLRGECAHVVQTVADLDKDDADVVAHGEQQFLEVLGLCRCLVTKDSTADLG